VVNNRTQKSFLQRIGDGKRRCASWKGQTLTYSSDIGPLRKVRHTLEALFDHILTELDPYRRVLQSVSFDGEKVRCGSYEVSLEKKGKVLVVGAGKASHQMARALHEIFGERVQGVVATHRSLAELPSLGNILFQPSGHPNPDEGSVKAAHAILRVLESAESNDIVFSLISGGGSAMMELPVPGVTLEDYNVVNELLNRAGFDIGEWNAVRKHLSQVKGGKLAQRATHARCVFNLMVSDVKGDRPELIASGPFVADPSTFKDASRVLSMLQRKARALGKDIPSAVLSYINKNLGDSGNETPTTIPPNVVHLIVASNSRAIDLSAEWLTAKGIHVPAPQRVLNLSGDSEEAVCTLYSLLVNAVNSNPEKPAAVIAGGEATVDVTRYPEYQDATSYGGRMQMMAALTMYLIEDLPVVGLFAATDCRDGKPPLRMRESAGALIDGTTLQESRRKGVDTEHYINACNTYEMHEHLSTQLYKEKFITNVMDLVLLVYVPIN